MISRYFVLKQDQWLDENVSSEYLTQPLAMHWARIAKISEEHGEVVDAFIRFTGLNPRKGHDSEAYDEVLNELADVIITATLAIQHFTKDTVLTENIISDRVRAIRARTEEGT